MKFALSRLKIGQDLVAQVSECFADGDVIVAYYGDLIRVKNQTTKRFTPGEMIPLKVISLNPIAFQYVTKTRKSWRGIDVSV